MKRLFVRFVCCVSLLIPLAAQAQLPDFREIVKSHSPAVVKILVEHDAATMRGQGGPLDAPEIPEYLRRFFEYRGGPPQQQRQRRQHSMGSGFIISETGYVVTNNHVVDRASRVVVRLNDRREFDAEVIGKDERSDLALLKVEGKDLPMVRLAESETLEVGEWVLAIGSPFGLDYSVTAGIVSAKGRSLPTEQGDNYVPFIQTDVAINPGNSGGPLFNLKGEVVGVNSQIYTRTGGSIGLSFAIPISVVNNVVSQLRETGQVVRGWLGVSIQDVDRSLAESFSLDRPRGALIVQVQPDGPAAKAGLESGDVILRFDGAEIGSSAELPHVVGLIAPGTKAKVDIIRNRKARTITVEVGGLEARQQASVAGVMAGGDVLGLVVSEADEQTLQRWSLNAGVVVTEVIAGGPAEEANVMPGDVITMVDGTPVTSVDTYRRAIQQLEPGVSVPVRLIHRGNPRFIGIRPVQ